MSTQISQRDPRAQLGFDFADGFPIFRESPAGTWIEPKHTTAQYLAIFERCQHALPKARTMSNAAHRLFEAGLRGAMASHAEMLELGQGDGLYALWRGRNQPQGDDVTKFLQHCRRMIAGQWDSPGLDYQHRDASHHSATSMHIHELGTLTVRVWDSHQTGIDFKPWKTTTFLPSYLDGVQRVCASSAVFAGKVVCQKLAEPGDRVQSVTAFEHGGRSYIDTGEMFSEQRNACTAWRFCNVDDWCGPTYSYRSQVLAWDEGRKERGDMRGLVVRVRAQEVVLTAMTHVYDDSPLQGLDSLTTAEAPEEDEDDLADDGAAELQHALICEA